VADDAGIKHEFLQLGVGHLGNLHGIEVVEHLPVVLAFLEDGPPGKPGLHALEADHFEKVPRVVRLHAPLGVVVFRVERAIRRQPRATAFSIGKRVGHDPMLTFHPAEARRP